MIQRKDGKGLLDIGGHMDKPKLLDLFCGAGGAAKGYHRAGFDVYGVDIKPQPHYPYPFLQMDALEAIDRLIHGEGLTFSNGETLYLSDFAAFHASPPCQGYTFMNNRYPERRNSHPKLIKPVRDRLSLTHGFYVIENVMGAKGDMVNPVKLHGGMFFLRVNRPRLFETNLFMLMPQSERAKSIVGVYGNAPDGRRLWGNPTKCRLRAASSMDEAAEAMGINWMDWHEIKEAIPPAYTEYIGKYLLKHLEGY